MSSDSKHDVQSRADIDGDDPEQSARFIKAARELGADSPEAGEAFERALRSVLPPREPGKPAPKVILTRKPKGSRRKE
jgi:hypothetical protein